MSLPKKTVRTEIPAEVHRGLLVLQECSAFGTLERYVEALICRHVIREGKAAITRADAFQRAGIDRNFRESQFGDGVEQ